MAVKKTAAPIQEQTELERLIMLVWRWKFIYAAVVIAFVAGAVGYYRSRPLVYGATVELKIGRIANTLVEPWADIESSLRAYDEDAAAKKILFSVYQISPSRQDETKGTLAVTVIAQSSSPDDSRAFAKMIADDIITRHGRIYGKALSTVMKNRPQSADLPLYLIESYTSPTRMVGHPEPYSARGVSGAIENPASPGMGLKHFLVLAFFAGIFSGLLCIYLLDVALRRRKG